MTLWQIINGGSNGLISSKPNANHLAALPIVLIQHRLRKMLSWTTAPWFAFSPSMNRRNYIGVKFRQPLSLSKSLALLWPAERASVTHFTVVCQCQNTCSLSTALSAAKEFFLGPDDMVQGPLRTCVNPIILYYHITPTSIHQKFSSQKSTGHQGSFWRPQSTREVVSTSKVSLTLSRNQNGMSLDNVLEIMTYLHSNARWQMTASFSICELGLSTNKQISQEWPN